MTEWNQAAAARRGYADIVEGIGTDRWDESTLCRNWTVRDVTGHLASFVDVGLPSFFLNMAKHGFNYDKAADTLARKHGSERTPEQLLASLRDKADKKSAMPMFPESMTVLDVVVHTQDVRRGLKLDGEIDPELLTTALGFITEHKMRSQIIDPDTLEGLRFEAPDLDWSFGSGQEVKGPGEAVMMAICGRPTYGELTGDGVETLSSRQK